MAKSKAGPISSAGDQPEQIRTTTLRIGDKLHGAIKDMAADNRRSMHAQLYMIIEDAALAAGYIDQRIPMPKVIRARAPRKPKASE